MSLATRSARVAARSLRGKRIQPCQRRQASSEEYHPSNEKAIHMPNTNTSGSEGFGRAFYVSLAAVPLFYVGYTISTGGSDNFVNNLFQQYKEGNKESWNRDALHEAAVRQALLDRSAMRSQARETDGPTLRYPEQLNHGSPYNVSAGNSVADLSKLEQWYNERNAEAEQERLSRIKDGKITSVYEDR